MAGRLFARQFDRRQSQFERRVDEVMGFVVGIVEAWQRGILEQLGDRERRRVGGVRVEDF